MEDNYASIVRYLLKDNDLKCMEDYIFPIKDDSQLNLNVHN